MDAARFDALARALSTTGSRRRALATSLGGTLSLLGLTQTDAKKKKPCPPCKKRKKGTCKGTLPDGTPCTGGTCQGGSCVASLSCPAGQRRCRGTCQSVLICCENTDCAGGRTCQDGTCACPADKPLLCSGSTICQQCCVKADCTINPASTGPGVAECVNNVCTCSQAGTRYCGRNTSGCGVCCSTAECTNGEVCYEFSDTQPTRCQCPPFEAHCTGAGRTGCVSEEPDDGCLSGCGQPCNPQNGDAACPCPAQLVCDFDPTNQNGYFCAPR